MKDEVGEEGGRETRGTQDAICGGPPRGCVLALSAVFSPDSDVSSASGGMVGLLPHLHRTRGWALSPVACPSTAFPRL